MIRKLAAGLVVALFYVAAASMPNPVPAPAQEAPRLQSTAGDRESVMITVYNQNFGLVREVRDLSLTRGLVSLEFGDVASSIQPETVHLRALDGGRLTVLEQNYQYDLLSPQKLLEKYVGRTVKVYRWNEVLGQDEMVEAEVLSVNQGTILKIGDEITFNYPGRLAFPEVPDNLIARPTLLWKLDSGSNRQRVETSYLTHNLNWKADYVVVVDENDRRGDITGWVTLTNQSGASYENAQLKLVAGDVQRVSAPNAYGRARKSVMAAEMSMDEAFAEEAFFEYHLYTLNRPATVLQVESNQKVGVFLDFENSEKNGLGMPLPAGVVRVYKSDASGAQQFIGEDRIDHTPRDETVRIKMGEAFDVVGDRRQMDFDIIADCVTESEWEIKLRNHKDEEAEVEVFEPIGADWEILSSSHRATKLDAHTFKFTVKIPPRGEQTIKYRVRVRWC